MKKVPFCEAKSNIQLDFPTLSSKYFLKNQPEIHRCRNRVPVILLQGYGGWVDKVISLLYAGHYLDERKRTKFFIAKTPEEAVATALKVGEKRLRDLAKKGKEFYRQKNKLRTGLRYLA